jgi:hypothetical protein
MPKFLNLRLLRLARQCSLFGGSRSSDSRFQQQVVVVMARTATSAFIRPKHVPAAKAPADHSGCDYTHGNLHSIPSLVVAK